MKLLMATALVTLAMGTAASETFANTCLSDNKLTTLERGACLEEQGNRLEAQMVDAYQAVKASHDSANEPWDKRLDEALQQSQIDFERLRDSQCSYEATQAQGGTALGILNLACRNEMTEGRISLLLSYEGAN